MSSLTPLGSWAVECVKILLSSGKAYFIATGLASCDLLVPGGGGGNIAAAGFALSRGGSCLAFAAPTTLQESLFSQCQDGWVIAMPKTPTHSAFDPTLKETIEPKIGCNLNAMLLLTTGDQVKSFQQRHQGA